MKSLFKYHFHINAADMAGMKHSMWRWEIYLLETSRHIPCFHLGPFFYSWAFVRYQLPCFCFHPQAGGLLSPYSSPRASICDILHGLILFAPRSPHIYIYIYICVCVCVCVLEKRKAPDQFHS